MTHQNRKASTSSETHLDFGYMKHKQGDFDGAIAAYTKAIKLDPTLVNAYVLRGLIYQHMEQYNAAIADYDEVIRLKPDDAMVYSNRGLAKDKLGQHTAAIADYNEAINLEPELSC